MHTGRHKAASHKAASHPAAEGKAQGRKTPKGRVPRGTAPRGRVLVAALGIGALLAAGCGSDEDESSAGEDAPIVLATTSIWGDVLVNVACEGGIDLHTLLPRGADPHRFEPSLADRGLMDDSVVVFSNGLELEESLLDVLEAVEQAGTPVFRIGEHVETIPYSSGGGHDDQEQASHDDHADHEDADDHDSQDDHEDHQDDDHDATGHEDDDGHDDHGDDDHSDHDDDDHDEAGHEDDGDDDHDETGHEDHGDDDHDEAGHEGNGDHEGHAHDHSGDDPHVWFDPQRVSGVLDELGEQLVSHAGLDPGAVEGCIDDYREELSTLDDEIAELVESVPEANRLLVTNHDALGYFAERYGFEVIGTVIPAPTTLAETNPAQLEGLAQTISEHRIAAIFAESQHSARDAEALAARVGDVKVVTLFTGSLGPDGSGADDYLGFMRANARLIAEALG